MNLSFYVAQSILNEDASSACEIHLKTVIRSAETTLTSSVSIIDWAKIDHYLLNKITGDRS